MNILDQDILLNLFQRHYLFFAGCVFVLALMLTMYLTPKVLWVSREKGLITEVNHRSSHKVAVPPFGGVSFFLVLVLVILLLQALRESNTGNNLVIGLCFLFLAGLKDDLVVSSARLKMISQLFAGIFIVFSPELTLNNLQGFLGIYEIPLILGYGLKLLLVVALINAYNLIDGIDGLAAIVGIIISLTYALVFHVSGKEYFVLISLAVSGILAGFLRFNFSREKNKIFMGDGGSLIIGFMIAFLSLKLVVMDIEASVIYHSLLPENRLLFALAVLFIPIFDTLRVIVIRLGNGNSPFEADRNHMHHVLLDLGLNHKKASFSLGAFNLLVIFCYVLGSQFLNNWGLFYLMIILIGLSAALFNYLKKLGAKKIEERDLVPGE